ncbi:MAG: hypothetical protein ACE5FP_05750, partial [Gemmatimonadota bacterium]
MTRPTRQSSFVAIGFAALIGIAACESDDPMGGGGGGGGNISDPTVFETEMRQFFRPAALGVFNGLERLLVALNGGAQDGVTVVPNQSGGVDVSIAVDLDGDGSRESTINGGSAGSIQTGAAVSVTGVTDPGLPSLAVGVDTRVTQTSPTTVLVDQMTGGMGADPPGSGNAADASIVAGAVNLDLVTGNPS